MPTNKKLTKAYREVLDQHRSRLATLTDKRALPRLKKLYDRAQAGATRNLAAVIKAKRGDTFTAMQHRVVISQLRQGQAVIAHRMAGALGDITRQTQTATLQGLAGDIVQMQQIFTGAEVALPIEQAAVFQGIIDGRAPSLLAQHEASMLNYGTQVVRKAEDQLALSLMQGESTLDAIDRIEEVTGGEWWQAERIVRTENAYAANATQADGITAVSEELPDLMLRWNEYCDDDSGAPLDDRVGVDSIAMHGQVTAPGSVFIMPPSAPFPDAKGNTRVSDSLVGGAWEFPPNRPNDRATVAPWRPDWGVRGWVYDAGRRRWIA